jgi:peptidoglycan/LPS O-acetylase OafA/YrhL
MPAIALYARFLASRSELAGLRRDTWSTLLYIANWQQIWTQKSYWDLFTAPSPLEHCWSLSIEEQFYVAWPLFVLLLLTLGSPRILAWLAALFAAASAMLMFHLYSHDNVSRVYLGTDTRATAILIGALLAMSMPLTARASERATRWLDGAGVVALGGLAVAWWRLSGQSPFLYRGGFWLTQVADAVLIACAVAGSGGWVARLLALAPLTWVGTISYGLYLWHWPVDVVLTADRCRIEGWQLEAIRLGVTFAIAIVSYRYLELPIRTKRLAFGRPMYILPLAFAAAILLVVRATFAREAHLASLPEVAPAAADAEVRATTLDAAAPDPAMFNLVIFGDSTSNSIGWVMRGLHEPNVTIHLFGRDGCNMLYDTCYSDKWTTHEAETHADAALVFLAGAFEHDLDGAKSWETPCDADWAKAFEAHLLLRVGALGAAGAPDEKVFLATIPYPLGESDNADFRRRTDCINRSIRKSATAMPNVHLVEVGPALCPKGKCQRRAGDADAVIRPDGVHYSMDGGAEIARWTLDHIRAAFAL